MADDYDLERFISAQEGVYPGVVAELRAGRKTGHWIWFIFPQVAGLGRSAMSQHYAIASIDQARAYLAHPLLGPRLRECAGVVLATGRSAEEILGGIDAVKLRSSMTLFHRADHDEPVFIDVLDRFYGGIPDPATDRILGLA
ncbi:MAG TPA: DUF1810 domain-containing protein [Candidatus Limnocylindrales bacterium]|nr:DUF1810 domain-containing protein [Candidatus Limnocylindrales bacterium]